MEEKILLICFPYAGASANCYIRWYQKFPSNIEVFTIEMSGHGRRYNEPLYQSLAEAIDDIYNRIVPFINSRKYYLFGHSMGGIILYELVNLLMKRKKNMPQCIFLSGVKPPHRRVPKTEFNSLSNREFVSFLVSLGGIDNELASCKEYLDFFLPIIRHDFLLIENYEYRRFSVSVPLAVFYAEGDVLNSPAEMLEWIDYSYCKCEMFLFEGNHFFIHSNTDRVVEVICNIMFFDRPNL